MKKNILLFLLITCGTFYYVSAQNTYPWPQSGNVGIGTSSPSSLLELRGGVGGPTSIFTLAGLRSGIMHVTPANVFEVNFPSYYNATLGYTFPEYSALVVNPYGTVIIGDDIFNPEPSLKVEGQIQLFGSTSINDQKLFLRGSTDINHFLGFHSSFAGRAMDGPVLAGYGSGMLGTTQNGNNLSLFWNKDGKVGIGTTNLAGTHKLYVAGSMIAEEVVVKLQGNWPDYVFDENFELRSLDQVEDFIKKEKHLPGVPSASEVAENGVEVGEMNAVLLKKIEELTLYVIKLNEEVNELKKLEK